MRINSIYSVNPYYYNKTQVDFKGDNKPEKRPLQYFTRMSYRNYNLKKLEGQQAGIKIFNGLNLKEICFALENLNSIALKRTCSNQCLHCYAGAIPETKENAGFITRMTFEDYKDLIEGIEYLKKKTGLKPLNERAYTSLFYDTDCMGITLKDKTGTEHDFTELTDMFYNATKCRTIFDTAGWNHKNPILQERAKKYVNYMMYIGDKQFYQINLSLNPFNPMYAKALKLGYDPKQKNIPPNDENAMQGKKLYEFYIEKMANMLHIFAPLLGDKRFSLIVRAFSNDNKKMVGFTTDDFKIIKEDILKRLKELYEKDNANEALTEYVLKEYSKLMDNVDNNLLRAGKLDKLCTEYQDDYQMVGNTQYYKSQNDYYLLNKMDTNDIDKTYQKIIDANGRVYLTDNIYVIPTDIYLNFESKNKTTPPLGNSKGKMILSREIINNKGF